MSREKKIQGWLKMRQRMEVRNEEGRNEAAGRREGETLIGKEAASWRAAGN